jgi:hypothetical protein
MQTFCLFKFQMKTDLSFMERTMKQKEIKQISLKVMRNERKKVGDNLFNQELNDEKEKKDKHS